jgi:hypothetical protein
VNELELSKTNKIGFKTPTSFGGTNFTQLPNATNPRSSANNVTTGKRIIKTKKKSKKYH